MKTLRSVVVSVVMAPVLLSGPLRAETFTATNVVVAPLSGAHWTQNAPYNDYSPKGTTVFASGWEAGCVATAAAQELYYWQWPWRLDAVHQTSHPVLNESDLALRFDGNVPFDWANMKDSYGDSATLKQKHAAAHLVLACQSLVQMRFVSGGGEAMKNLPGTMEWYEYAGQVTPRESDANLAALKADFEFGSPVQTGINFKGYGGHEVVGLGYATGTNSVGEAKNLIWLNLGWGGGSDGWYDIGETDSSETIIKATQLGFRPIKSVQIEPVAPVSGSEVTINWHLPNCYTNKIDGFIVAKKTPSASTTTWTDDFSTGGKGRSSNTNEIIVTNGRLYGWQGTASGIYTYDEVLLLTEDSVLSYKVHDDYMSGMSVRVEAKVGDGGWQTISEPTLHGGWGPAAVTETVGLGVYADNGVRFRFVVEYVSGSIWTTGVNAANVWFDDVSISNVKTFETVATDSTIAASARSATFSGLTTGDTYGFSVTPIMSDGSVAVTQTVATTIGDPAESPVIGAVTMTPAGSDLVQEGFYADIAMGWNVIDVACENVAKLEAFPSHQSVLPQDRFEVVDNCDGSFSINIDANEVAAKWAGQRFILTLKAANATGETVYKDLELCLKASGVPEKVPGGKVWTGEDATSGEDYTAKWSNGLPSDGDKVTFLANNGEYGALMKLNLSTPTTLGYVLVTGSGPLKISGTSSETLTANVLKNDIQVEVNSSKFKVTKAIPSANIVIDSGSSLDCEIDQSRSGYVKKAGSGDVSALDDSSLWMGTVVFSGYTAANLNFNSYGNTNSSVRLCGVSGWLATNTTFNPAVELVDDGTTPALNWSDGSTGAKETFKKLTGSGTFKTSGSGGAAERVVINDIDDFKGSFDLSLKRVSIGESEPTTTNNGSISVNYGKSATVHGGSTWKASGGFYFGGSQTIAVDGAINGAITAESTGTVLVLAPTATVSATSLSFTNNTIRLAIATGASPTISVTGAADLTDTTIEVNLDSGATAADSITIMSAASFSGVDSITLDGLDGYSLEVTDGVLYAIKDPTAPTPTAVWVGGQFLDAAELHGGYSVVTNLGNTINDDGNIVIGGDSDQTATLGAAIAMLAGESHNKVSVLVNYLLPSTSAPADNSVIAGVLDSYNLPFGAICKTTDGDAELTGYWQDGNNLNTSASYAFTPTTPTIGATEGYLLISYYSADDGGNYGVKIYAGDSIAALSGGQASSLQFRNQTISNVSIGGPAAEGTANPWSGMEILGIALFVDEWFDPEDVELYTFPTPMGAGTADNPEEAVAKIRRYYYATLADAVSVATASHAKSVEISLLRASDEVVTLDAKTVVTETSAGLFTGTLSGQGTLVLAGTRSSALSFGEWTGTVVLPSNLANIGKDFHFNYYGQEGSTVQLASNVSGWIQREDTSQPAIINPAIEIPEGKKLTLTGFSPSFRYALKALKGNGEFVITFDGDLPLDQAAYSPYFRIVDISEFRGKLSTAKPTLVLGTMILPTKPDNNTNESEYTRRILIYAPVTAHDDWSADYGVVLADLAATLTVGSGVTAPTISPSASLASSGYHAVCDGDTYYLSQIAGASGIAQPGEGQTPGDMVAFTALAPEATDGDSWIITFKPQLKGGVSLATWLDETIADSKIVIYRAAMISSLMSATPLVVTSGQVASDAGNGTVSVAMPAPDAGEANQQFFRVGIRE